MHGQRLLQGSVKDGIAGGIHEVGENDGVFFGEGAGAAGAQEQASANKDCDQCGGSDGGNLPGFSLNRGNSGRRAALGGTDEGVRPYVDRSGNGRAWLVSGPRTGIVGCRYRAGTCGYGTSGVGITLQALQVGADVGGVLVAEVAVFLQRFVDDVFELRGQVGI